MIGLIGSAVILALITVCLPRLVDASEGISSNMGISQDDLNKTRSLIENGKHELLGLLDYYSSRATAHASISVAVVLGIFGLLGIYRWPFERRVFPVEEIITKAIYVGLFTVIYGLLWLAAIYLVMNFGWYTQIADRAKFLLLKRNDLIERFASYQKSGKDVDGFLIELVRADWLSEKAKCFHRRYVIDLKPGRMKPEVSPIVMSEESFTKTFHICLGLITMAVSIYVIRLVSDWISVMHS